MAAANDRQTALRQLWLDSPGGQLSARTQAFAWALREAWQADRESTHGMLQFVADRVTKANGEHPSRQAVADFFSRIDEDDEWWPGKTYGRKRGRKRALSGLQRATIARSAMRMKKQGDEPTYAGVVATCKRAVTNPDSGNPVTAKRVYDVFRESCYDDAPDKPWTNRPRLQKVALTAEAKASRLKWATYIQGRGDEPHWFFRHVVWTDICNSILPRTQKKAKEQTLARKGKKGWISEGSQEQSENLRGKQEALKQNSWDSLRVWWFPMLARGKLHVEVLPEDFPGETEKGRERAARCHPLPPPQTPPSERKRSDGGPTDVRVASSRSLLARHEALPCWWNGSAPPSTCASRASSSRACSSWTEGQASTLRGQARPRRASARRCASTTCATTWTAMRPNSQARCRTSSSTRQPSRG